MLDSGDVVNFIREQVPDWDDEVKAIARFKAFSGQRFDWEPQFQFWRDLIIKVAHQFDLLFVTPSEMKNRWFNREGLVPLCIDHVLLEMYKAGDLLRITDLGDPMQGQLSQILKKMIRFSASFKSISRDILSNRLILVRMLEDKANYAVKTLSETHWTYSCVVTMSKFESLFREHDEAFAVLSFLSEHGKAKCLSIKKRQLIEGVKVSLSSASVSNITAVDSDILLVVWTVEELQKQLDNVDKQHETSRKLGLAALKSGNRDIALRNARQLKISSQRREKLASFLNQLEGVLRLLADAESTNKVTEALQVGSRAAKENRFNVQQVELCLQELDEFMVAQEQVYKALESTSYDEDLEEELKKLELQDDVNLISSSKSGKDLVSSVKKDLDSPNELSDAISNLKIQDMSPDLNSKTSTKTQRLELQAE